MMNKKRARSPFIDSTSLFKAQDGEADYAKLAEENIKLRREIEEMMYLANRSGPNKRRKL
jgi:hypothetical protein